MALFDFLKKVSDPASMITDAVMGVANGAADIVDRFVTNPEEKAAIEKELRDFQLEAQRLAMKQDTEYFVDRQSAREMYKDDSGLQKTFAIVFLVFYCLLSMGMIGMIISMAFFGKTVELPDWGVMLITSVFTGMSVKVNTIVDFLFGGSKMQHNSDKKTAEAFGRINKE